MGELGLRGVKIGKMTEGRTRRQKKEGRGRRKEEEMGEGVFDMVLIRYQLQSKSEALKARPMTYIRHEKAFCSSLAAKWRRKKRGE